MERQRRNALDDRRYMLERPESPRYSPDAGHLAV